MFYAVHNTNYSEAFFHFVIFFSRDFYIVHNDIVAFFLLLI